MFLEKIRVRRAQRQAEREQVEAASDFAWVWADTVNEESYAYGASLECSEAHALARLFTAFTYFNTAAELMAEHAAVCGHDEPHNSPADAREEAAA
ncbi:hypothetical protein [Streptomyces sp. NPDC002922]|uniref:hypothetical protein n=1 Tax=Streptomyces sp. NPDC002922 TaxID=3154439 RepID=UPI0033AF3EDE